MCSQAGELEAAPSAASKPPAASEPPQRPASDERRSRPAQPERQGSLRRQPDGPAGSRADRKVSEREADSKLQTPVLNVSMHSLVPHESDAASSALLSGYPCH